MECGPKKCVFLFILLGVFITHSWGQNCPSQKQAHMKFTMNTRRNQTGHWITQVQLDQGSNMDVKLKQWNVEVEQSTATCGDLESLQLVATLIAPPPRAGPGYELHRGVGYYKLHREIKTWSEARQICEQEGAHLAIINSEEESEVLRSIFQPVAEKLKVVWAFIGFHDKYTEGQYLTIFDEPLKSTGFYRWSSQNQPDNYGGNNTYPGEDCGSMNTNGGLNDLPCLSKVPFLCEQELW